ncbi:major facilitator superfamily domain-containing protein [Phyllosticta citribraziliensis]|uniref:Major facilitator superfamily domain-containing protein n=1 Tax=Phyllosticta citribraziliensis TaxID=989973 RepID=A0ABR1LML6_9PEZI
MTPLTEKYSAEDNTARPVGAENASSDAEYDDIETGAVDEKKLLGKLDLHLLPGVAILYLLSFLDRSNVANAKLEGLTKDLGMTGNQYLTSLTLYFVGYVLFEICPQLHPYRPPSPFIIPCNVILKRTTPKMWLPTLTLVWGVVATLMGVTQSMDGFFVVRFFLGVTESGLFPGVVYYLSNWYKRTERVYRVALFFSAASLAGAFGGILAFGIGKMNGVSGLKGWRWIFIIEGILTVAVSLAGYWFICNYPSTAGFLTPKERKVVLSRLTSDSDSTADEPFNWTAVLTCLRDPKCWLYGAVFHSLSLPLYTLSLFLPTIIKDLGYTAARAQLLTVPPYALATLLTIAVAIISERLHHRSSFMIGSAILAVTGYAILIGNAHHVSSRPGVSYAGTFLAAGGIYPATALGLAWPAMNVAGQTKRATACALQISVGNLGAVIGTQIYRPRTAPGYVTGHSVALAYMAANAIIVSLLWLVLKRENARKERELAAAGSDAPTGQMTGDEDLRWKFNV